MQTIDSIQNYIIDTPDDLKKLQKLVQAFKKVLKNHIPDYHPRLKNILKRPFPLPPKLFYFSFCTGTIQKQKLKKFPLPTSWSEIDFRLFHDQTSNDRVLNFEDKNILKNEMGGLPLRKSNSSHALYELGKKAELRKPLTMGISNTKIQQKLSKKMSKAKKNRWLPIEDDYSDSEEAVSDSEGSGDEESSDIYVDENVRTFFPSFIFLQ